MALARDASSPAVKLSLFIGTQTTSQASNGAEIWLGSGATTPTLTTVLSSVNLIMSNTATFAWSVVAYEVLPARAADPPDRRAVAAWP